MICGACVTIFENSKIFLQKPLFVENFSIDLELVDRSGVEPLQPGATGLQSAGLSKCPVRPLFISLFIYRIIIT